MRKLIHGAVSFVLILIISLAWVTPALAATAQATCTNNGGTWTGPDAQNGRCVYPVDSPMAFYSCNNHFKEYWVDYESNAEVSTRCRNVGPRRIASDGAKIDAVTLRLHNGKGRVNFAVGTCKRNCSISANLPAVAKDNLILIPLATMNVRPGSPSGLYQICFSNVNGKNLRIYRFTNSVWVPISPVSSAAQVCTTTSGDGSFYLH